MDHTDHGALSAFDGAPVWLNSEPLTAEMLRGRAVLVDVWTYSCVNWLRTLPYVRAWHERYRDRGLVVVGVHAPEFGFEHDLDNVRRAVAALDVGYPVVIDNDFAIWRSLDNHYWPAVYLVDGDGRVRFEHFGEEAYEETERAIQQLLGVDEELVDVDAGGLAEAADWDALRSPETYLGSARGERGRSGAPGAGEWSLEQEAAVLDGADGLDHLPLRGPRRQPGARAAGLGWAGRVLRAPGRGAARRGPRARRRRARCGLGVRAPAVPAHPPPRARPPAGPSRSRSTARASGHTSSPSAERDAPRRDLRDPALSPCRPTLPPAPCAAPPARSTPSSSSAASRSPAGRRGSRRSATRSTSRPRTLGLVLLAIAVGSVISMPLAGVVVGRLGTARTVAVMALVAAAGLATAGLGYPVGVAPVLVGLFALGVGNGTWDVAMNVEGSAVEQELGRAIMPRFHAGFSVGTVAGALIGAAMVALGVSATVHLLAVAALVAIAGPLAVRDFLPDGRRAGRGRRAPQPAQGVDRAAHAADRPVRVRRRVHRGHGQRLARRGDDRRLRRGGRARRADVRDLPRRR